VYVAEEDGGSLEGILPCYIDRGASGGNVGMLRFLGDQYVGSDYLNLIVRRGREEEVIPFMFRHVLEDGAGASGFRFGDMDTTSRILPVIAESLKGMNLHVLIERGETCPFSPLPATSEEFLKGLSGKFRSYLKRTTRNLEQQLSCRLIKTSSIEDIPKDFQELFRLHNLRRESIHEGSAFSGEISLNFHMDIGRQFLENGWLQLYFLTLDDQSAASIYCYDYGGKMYYYQAGFDPGYEKMSVGVIVMWKCIENAISRGLREFDFLRGDELYKTRWTKSLRTTTHVSAYRKNLAGSFAYYRKVSVRKLKDLLHRLR